ncbi:MAG: helix-turn-helix transcriptional regulator [Clostridia bacterium]|nr:helix-turn-helix transcriptional regulator [Clostridia bacterium]
MRNKNICKFPISAISEPLTVSKYVKETDEATMKTNITLSLNKMILVAQGEGEFCFSSTSVPFKTGDVVFGFKGEEFYLKNGNNVIYLYIEFDGNRAQELFKRFGITVINRKKEGNDGLIPMWEESLLRASEHNVDLASESILLYTFSRFLKSTDKNDELVEKIVEITEENFSSASLSISEIATALSYNPKYVSHVFKQRMGINYSEYLTKTRIKHAISLLDFGIDSIKNVALLSGFTDPLYFSNVFKKQIGVSPTLYLKNKDKK